MYDWHIKGVPKTATKTGKNSYKYTNLVKTKESMRRNLTAGVKTERTKMLTNKYEKRYVTKSGTTKPIHL